MGNENQETGNEFAVMEHAMEIVIAFKADGAIVFANRQAREKMDYTKEELLMCNMAEIFWQEFQQSDGRFAPFDIEELTGKEESVIYRKNSSCFPAEISIYNVSEDCYCLFAKDITERKSMDVRIRQLREEEAANQKMRNEFTANVTHELRTPVNGIKGHVTTLLDAIEDPGQKKTLEIILYCCDNMSSIINNILDYSKMEAGEFVLEEHEFDFYNMMENVLATHMAEVNKKELKFGVYIDDNIPRMLVGDELRIVRILNNLLSNAIKFTLVGQVGIDVNMTMQVQDEIELFFMVQDTGIGISEEEQDKLFQSYKQADASITRRFGGTGLGLSITKQLVEMMNGTIFVESEKGKGSIFSFNIKLKSSENTSESKDLSETYQNWSNLMVGMENDAEDTDYFTYGTDENKAEVKKRMEKLLLSIELGSWEKAETLAETLKALTDDPEGVMKKLILRMEMGIRKENYDKSMEAYERMKNTLTEQWGEW